MNNGDTHPDRFRGMRWERGEADEEDVEIYGEGVEVWELWDYGGEEGRVVDTCFQCPVRKEDE